MKHSGKVDIQNNWYPKNFDWYIKWAATVCMICSMIMRSAGPEYRIFDLAIGTFGIALWLWVSVMWNDRALIILNAISIMLVGSTFLREL